MTGLGEDVYIDNKANREAVLDELVAESQRLGLYGDAPGAESLKAEGMLIEMAIRAIWAVPGKCQFSYDHARAAMESLGIPLSVLEELKAGTRRAVRVETFKLPSGRDGRIPNVGDVTLDAAYD